MTGKTHREVALATSIAIGVSHLALTQTLTTPVLGTVLIPLLWVPLSVAGGYFPDIDKKNATAYRWFKKYHLFFYVTIHASLLILPWYLTAGFLLAFLGFELLVLYSTHRRETHSIIFHAVLIGVFYFLSTLFQPLHPYAYIFVFNILLGFVIGSLTHPIADKFNIKYVHLFFPVETIFASKDRPRQVLPNWGKIITGSMDEDIFKRRWFVLCGVAVAGLGIPALLSFIGVEIMLLTEVIFISAIAAAVILLWRFVNSITKKILASVVACIIIWTLITHLIHNLEHLNFIGSIFI